MDKALIGLLFLSQILVPIFQPRPSAGGGSGAPSIKSTCSNNGYTATSIGCSFTAAAGDELVVFNNGQIGPLTATVSTGSGSSCVVSWAQIGQNNNNGQVMAVGQVTSGGTCVPTVTLSGAASSTWNVDVLDVTGSNGTIDASGYTTLFPSAGFYTSATTPSITTSVANDLIIAVLQWGGAFTVGGVNSPYSLQTFSDLAGGAAYLDLASPGSTSATFSFSSSYSDYAGAGIVAIEP